MTMQYQRSRCQRKKVEMLFAHLKRILKLDRLRLRGLTGATDEVYAGCCCSKSTTTCQAYSPRTSGTSLKRNLTSASSAGPKPFAPNCREALDLIGSFLCFSS
jgi:hypothetical protein